MLWQCQQNLSLRIRHSDVGYIHCAPLYIKMKQKLNSAAQFIHNKVVLLNTEKIVSSNSQLCTAMDNISTGSPIFHCRTFTSVPIFFRLKKLIFLTWSEITAKPIWKIYFYLLPEDFYVQPVRNYWLLRSKTMKRDKFLQATC